MKRVAIIVLAAGVLGVAAWWIWHGKESGASTGELTIYGNIDLRQVDLAFQDNERIASVLAQEGDRVHKGQVLARLDTSRLEPQLVQAVAQADAQQAVVDRLHNGNRPEEIAQARANVQAAIADAANAQQQFDRLMTLAKAAVSQQDLDNAKAALDVAAAKLAVNRKALDLEIAGPRKEDIAQAEAMLKGEQAQVAYLARQLADAELKAPSNAVVRSRLLEPGDMASPQKPVFSLAIVDPKWVRAYVGEPDLGKVHPGMSAGVMVDSFPGKTFDGWVGFISPIAEFTPKDVQTEELRTSLVYEVRVFVNDPTDTLRLGMPATVHLHGGEENPAATTQQGAP